MYPILVPLFGSVAIRSFGVMLALGLITFLSLIYRHPTRKLIIGDKEFQDLAFRAIVLGLVGGRLFYTIVEWQSFASWRDIFSIFNGGISILGGVASAAAYLLWYSAKQQIALWPLFDITGLYAPLFHAIARIGCFLAGCCHGTPTESFFSITYTHPEIAAPLFQPLHPAQLYSFGAFMLIFVILYYLYTRFKLYPGQLAFCYLMLSSAERFWLDFLRGDRVFVANSWLSWFSAYQWIALGLFCSAAIAYISRSYDKKTSGVYESF